MRAHNKLIAFVAFAALFVVTTIASASAHDVTYQYSPHFSYYSDPHYNEAAFYYSFKDEDYNCCHYYTQPYYYDTPYEYRYYSSHPQRYYPFSNDYIEYLQKRRAVRFLEQSFNTRYDNVAGKTSGEAFYYNYDSEGKPSTNWRYKEAYDYRLDGRDSNDNYYYNPRYDSQSGNYNWRY